jgi:hypothetical protein
MWKEKGLHGKHNSLIEARVQKVILNHPKFIHPSILYYPKKINLREPDFQHFSNFCCCTTCYLVKVSIFFVLSMNDKHSRSPRFYKPHSSVLWFRNSWSLVSMLSSLSMLSRYQCCPTINVVFAINVVLQSMLSHYQCCHRFQYISFCSRYHDICLLFVVVVSSFFFNLVLPLQSLEL